MFSLLIKDFHLKVLWFTCLKGEEALGIMHWGRGGESKNEQFKLSCILRLKVIIKVKQEYHSLHVLNVPSSHGDVHSDALHGKNVVSKC